MREKRGRCEELGVGRETSMHDDSEKREERET